MEVGVSEHDGRHTVMLGGSRIVAGEMRGDRQKAKRKTTKETIAKVGMVQASVGHKLTPLTFS